MWFTIQLYAFFIRDPQRSIHACTNPYAGTDGCQYNTQHTTGTVTGHRDGLHTAAWEDSYTTLTFLTFAAKGYMRLSTRSSALGPPIEPSPIRAKSPSSKSSMTAMPSRTCSGSGGPETLSFSVAKSGAERAHRNYTEQGLVGCGWCGVVRCGLSGVWRCDVG